MEIIQPFVMSCQEKRSYLTNLFMCSAQLYPPSPSMSPFDGEVECAAQGSFNKGCVLDRSVPWGEKWD